jgi:protein O-GlcNAc transferase
MTGQAGTSVSETLIQGIGLQNQGQREAAAALFAQALALEPTHAHALYSLSLLRMQDGRLEEAFALCSKGVATNPAFAPLWYLNGSVLQAMGHKTAALASFDRALQIQPDYVEVLLNSGALLRAMFRHKEALERFNQILAIQPDHAAALANCGILLTEFKQSEAAIAAFERLTSVAPGYDYALGLLFYERMHICDWRGLEPLQQRIVAGVRAGQRVCKSLAFMSASDQAAEHLQAAQIFARSYCPPQATRLWNGEVYAHKKIRLAYVSPDLREHPVGHLMAGVLEQHDHSRFETIAISLGADDQSRLRARMQKAFDHFIDARDMDALQIARLMRSMEVDIAVDLGGYTSDTKTALFAHRPAPIQVNYLGYPGSMGVAYYDYIIADRQVIPPDQQQHYTEKVAYLPDSYLPLDNSVRPSERTPTRQECGLPEQGFVFCSFSHDYKIAPPVFAAWMRLLAQVPGSVLWLVSRNEVARANLQREAQAQGIAPERLVFAARVPLVEDHLARYRQAGIFLDTYPYNAHTTAADALTAGLPVVTRSGSAFPSRVAGSVLRAAGLPQLVADSLEAYEAMALELAQQPHKLARLKQQLLANTQSQPLFDTQNFCRALEGVYAGMQAYTPSE